MGCVYCKSETNKKSREHVISRCVLDVIGLNRNSTRSSIFKNAVLIDHQQIIKDVCKACNSNLSEYDVAGAQFAFSVNRFFDATNKSVIFNEKVAGWLVKTHLNFIRTVSSKLTGKFYTINDDIYDHIINMKELPTDLLRLYVDGWEGEEYLWNAESEKRIQYFQFKSVEFPFPRILVSYFKIKSIDTFLLLPIDNNYDNFEDRILFTLKILREDFNFDLQKVDIKKSISDGLIKIEKIVDIKTIKSFIRKI